MKYLPPFEIIKHSVDISTVKGQLRVNASYDDFINIIKLTISCVEVDSDWYLRQYRDVATAVQDGSVKSAQQHFLDDGYFEGRLPFPITVDEKWYLEQYPDVAESVRKGEIPSGTRHFADDGYREGRLPFGPCVHGDAC